jgi:hypothetical protein
LRAAGFAAALFAGAAFLPRAVARFGRDFFFADFLRGFLADFFAGFFLPFTFLRDAFGARFLFFFAINNL